MIYLPYICTIRTISVMLSRFTVIFNHNIGGNGATGTGDVLVTGS